MWFDHHKYTLREWEFYAESHSSSPATIFQIKIISSNDIIAESENEKEQQRDFKLCSRAIFIKALPLNNVTWNRFFFNFSRRLFQLNINLLQRFNSWRFFHVLCLYLTLLTNPILKSQSIALGWCWKERELQRAANN